MQTRHLVAILVAAVVAAALVIVGVMLGDDDPTVVTTDGAAQADTISIVGTGEARATPDVLRADLGVSVLADSAGDAAGRADERLQAMIAAAREEGVPDEDIQTSQLSLQPELDYREDPPEIRGYRAFHTVTVTIRDLDVANDVLGQMTDAGGDDAIINYVAFELDDDTAVVATAREAAFEDAMAKARQLAELADRELGVVRSVTEGVSQPPVILERPVEEFAGAEGAAVESIGVSPGQTTVTAQVTITVELR